MTDDVRWLAPEELRAWLSLMATVETLGAALDGQLRRDAGINHFEYMVIAGLSESPARTMPMSRLALMARGSLSRLSHALGRLEARGWVERDKGAGRHVDVRLTDEGHAAVVAIAPGHVAEARRLVVDVLGTDDLVTLGALCRRVLEASNPDIARVIDEVAPPA